jgi:hypothetical protein
MLKSSKKVLGKQAAQPRRYDSADTISLCWQADDMIASLTPVLDIHYSLPRLSANRIRNSSLNF